MVCGVKDKIMSLFIINTTKSYNIPTHVNNIYGDVNQQKRNRNKKQLIDNIIKNVRHLLRLKKNNQKKNNQRHYKSLFEQEEHYYKPVRIGNLYSNNYIEYELSGDINKTLLIKKYLDEIKLYLKDITNNFIKSDAWKIQ